MGLTLTLSTQKILFKKLNSTKNKFETKDKKTKHLDKNEKVFVNRVNSFYKITAGVLSTIVTTSPFYCPILALAATIGLVIISGLHYYDKMNNYELSHGIIKLFNKCFRRSKDKNSQDKNSKEDNNKNVDQNTPTPNEKILKSNTMPVSNEPGTLRRSVKVKYPNKNTPCNNNAISRETQQEQSKTVERQNVRVSFGVQTFFPIRNQEQGKYDKIKPQTNELSPSYS